MPNSPYDGAEGPVGGCVGGGAAPGMYDLYWSASKTSLTKMAESFWRKSGISARQSCRTSSIGMS